MKTQYQQQDAEKALQISRQEKVQVEQERSELLRQIGEMEYQLGRMKRWSSWRMTKPIRKWTKSVRKRTRKLRRVFTREATVPVQENLEQVKPGEERSYQQWIKLYDTLTEKKRSTIRAEIDAMTDPPLISIVMPVYNPPVEFLNEAIDSVKDQLYQNWELCIADDNSPDEIIRETIRCYAEADPRIKYVFREANGHISLASNSALELAKGEYIALLDHDDRLHPAALYYAAKEIYTYPYAGIIYSDEDKISDDGKRRDPYFKSDFNYDLFLCQNMISHLGIYKRSLVEQIGGFRVGVEGSQDYDLALRILELIEFFQIRHIPKVLYHWRIHENSTAGTKDAKPYAFARALNVVDEHFRRTKQNAKSVKAQDAVQFQRIEYNLVDPLPGVDIIIPTRDKIELLENCVQSILDKTDYPLYNITIIDNGSVKRETLELLARWQSEYSSIRVIKDNAPFNYSHLNNIAVKASNQDFVCLLNNDTEVISNGWLREMVSHASRSDIGAVGARLWYPNNTLQHGGVILGVGGVANHAHYQIEQNNPGYFGRACLQQNMAAVTGACLLVSKHKYLEVNGLDETHLPVAFNDIDFCLKLLTSGYRNVWTPYAELFHHESASRGQNITPEQQARFKSESRYMMEKWADLLEKDPFYNPNLSISSSDKSFSLAWPPRVD
ncbi:glycosyltransferase family 2 protein [Chlorobium phaeovibrioides]|nr:glycosyltransferase family 2 protein [Chlorobium phaeovibrioides]